MTNYHYDSVEHGDADALPSEGSGLVGGGDRLEGGQPLGLRKNLRPMVLAMIGLGALVVTMMWVRPFSSSDSATTSMTSPMPSSLGLVATRSCTFDECYAASCDSKVAPFICLRNNGGPHMGW